MCLAVISIVLQCSLDKVTRPAPQIDLLFNGSTPDSDTLTIVYASTARVTVYLYAVGGLESHSVNVDDVSRSDERYDGGEVVNCDTVLIEFELSGGTAANHVVSIATEDRHDQTTDKSLVIAFTPGGVVVVKPTFVSLPANATVSTGDSATFTAIAMGGNLTYQWQKNAVDIPNTNANRYTTPPVANGDNGAVYR
jgi:hypothetical protein